ncbi:acid phosphatase [Amniculicola lignicola CBS 123094]|uniref:Phytase A n=1 Tax=Amniculicola lignicola CBS 123094 TaxID=1392246 RepID=A0A6A5W907_9PLEO|nr:acid phosphatase [Amniculicola lignicola CBS 123094]
MSSAWNRIKTAAASKDEYSRLPLDDEEPTTPSKERTGRIPRACTWATAFIAITGLVGLWGASSILTANKSCDTIDDGFRCTPKVSHFWGQYALWFSVPSDVHVAPPKGCSATFANVLSRHGGRDPTAGKSALYALLIADIHNTAKQYPGQFAFLKDYEYTLGADQLTDVGRQEMVNSGAHFFRRYSDLAASNPPFVRSAGQDRVIESANKWLVGLAQASKQSTPASISVIIPEGPKWNNTLSHDTCPALEGGPLRRVGYVAQSTFAGIFIPPIQKRVNGNLGTSLTAGSIISLMDLCPFSTVAHPNGKVSPFCDLFTEEEWHEYDYYQSLGKWYGFGTGNPLGATQGVGYVNELIARLTDSPVKDETNTNTTLNGDSTQFPLGKKVYADFSHDNDMSQVYAALGLYNNTKALSNETIEGTESTNGFSAAWTVPFAGRMYVEKLSCKEEAKEEYVRIIMNDRVMPLEFCGGDSYGRCTLSNFVKSQQFAREGGRWSECFPST